MDKFNVDEWVLYLGDAAHTLFPPETNEGKRIRVRVRVRIRIIRK